MFCEKMIEREVLENFSFVLPVIESDNCLIETMIETNIVFIVLLTKNSKLIKSFHFLSVCLDFQKRNQSFLELSNSCAQKTRKFIAKVVFIPEASILSMGCLQSALRSHRQTLLGKERCVYGVH